jgi:hypothetical protein
MNAPTLLSSFTLLLPLGCIPGPADMEAWEKAHPEDEPPTDSEPEPDDTGEPDTGEVDDTGPDDTGSEDTVPVATLRGLSPTFGPRGGGTAVALQGVDLHSSAEVRFGGELATLQSATAEALVVHTPAVSEAGWVDVDLLQGGSEERLLGAYRYLDLDDASGLVGAMGALQWFDHVGEYWSSGTRDYGMLQLWIPSAPSATPYRELFASTPDSCVSDGFAVDSSAGLDLQGSAAGITGADGTDLRPAWNPYERRYELDIRSGELGSDAIFDLSLTGLWDLPDFTVEGFARTPAPFSLSAPAMVGRTPISLERDELDLRWDEIEAEWVVVYIARLSADGHQQLEILSCLATNDGAFSVPSEAWSGWQTGNQLYTYVGALREAQATVPLNNGDSSVAGISWQVGVILAR